MNYKVAIKLFAFVLLASLLCLGLGGCNPPPQKMCRFCGYKAGGNVLVVLSDGVTTTMKVADANGCIFAPCDSTSISQAARGDIPSLACP
jgi:hypothetical protein